MHMELLSQKKMAPLYVGYYSGGIFLLHLSFLPPAQGTLKPDSAGLISGLAEKAGQLKHGTGADDLPVVVVEFDTGYVESLVLVTLYQNPFAGTF